MDVYSTCALCSCHVGAGVPGSAPWSGLIDVLLLTVFPCTLAYRLLHGRVGGLKARLPFTALALPLVVIITRRITGAIRNTARTASSGPRRATS